LLKTNRNRYRLLGYRQGLMNKRFELSCVYR